MSFVFKRNYYRCSNFIGIFSVLGWSTGIIYSFLSCYWVPSHWRYGVCARVHTLRHAQGSQQRTLASPQSLFTLFFWDRISHWRNCSLRFGLASWPANSHHPPESFPRAGVPGTRSHASFLCRRDLNSDHHVGSASCLTDWAIYTARESFRYACFTHLVPLG